MTTQGNYLYRANRDFLIVYISGMISTGEALTLENIASHASMSGDIHQIKRMLADLVSMGALNEDFTPTGIIPGLNYGEPNQ